MHSSVVFGVVYRQQGNAKLAFVLAPFSFFKKKILLLLGAPAGRFKVGNWDPTVKKCEVHTGEKEGAQPRGVVCPWKGKWSICVCVLARFVCEKCWCTATKALRWVQFTGCKGNKIVI